MTGMAEDPMAFSPIKPRESKKPPVSPAASKILGVNSPTASPTKLTLAEKLKQRMRQGLDQSSKLHVILWVKRFQMGPVI